MKRMLTVLGAMTIGTAGAVAAQDADPVGEWEWVVEVEGQTFVGTMEIAGEVGAWTGALVSDQGTADIVAIEIDGQSITITADTGQGDLVLELELDGDDFEGLGMMDGVGEFPISGSRIGR